MPYFIFIVNPTAGKGVHSESLCARIRSYFSTQNIDFEIYRTVGPQDALQFVRSYPARKDNVPICFVACGGDGTLQLLEEQIAPFRSFPADQEMTM